MRRPEKHGELTCEQPAGTVEGFGSHERQGVWFMTSPRPFFERWFGGGLQKVTSDDI